MFHQKSLCLSIVSLLIASLTLANGDYIRTPDGIIVHPDSRFSGHAAAVKLSVIADNIIRVVSTPVGDPFRTTESLITTFKKDASLKWDISENDSEVVIHT